MDNVINKIRDHIGTVIAFLGFVLLSVLTFGDLGEVLSRAYWNNVLQNLSSIGFLSIGLTAVQVTIKQGIAEQALRTGLNSDETQKRYEEHKNIIDECRYKEKYIGYFLDEYNARKTKERKRAFIIGSSYKTEEDFLLTAPRRLKRHYAKICHCVTASKITWATTTVEYDKHGNVKTLAQHRTARAVKGTITGLITMLGVTLMARGLFFEPSNVPFWQKLVKFSVYILVIGLFSIPMIVKEVEKGKFGVPNDLNQLNTIWLEFKSWDVPKWVVREVDAELNKHKEVIDESEEATHVRADIQAESAQIQDIQ